MLFRSPIRFLAICCIAVTLILSFSGNHPAGNTGAPGDGVCTSCHGGGGGGFDGTITLSGVPSTAQADVTYTLDITVDVTQGSPIRGGFQIVALQDANDANAGDWSNNSSGSSLIFSGGREYFGHSPAQPFGGGGSLSWDADWTAPDINDDVTFYAVACLGNGSGSGGDKIIFATETITIDGGIDLDIVITDQSDVSCFDGDDGSATAEASGGMMPYDFEWDNGETGPVAINLDGGNHTVTVTDDNGNTAQTSVFIDEPDMIDVDPFIEHISCFGEEDGFADVDPFGGTGDLSCEWSDGIGSGCEQDGLEEGSYFVTVTDDNDCTEVFEIEIFEPNPLEANISSTDESAAGAEDGTATVIPLGGNPPYDYIWSDGTTESGLISTIEDLAPGDYSVTIIDDNNCEITAMTTVMPGGCALSVSSTVNHIECYGDSSGSISLELENFTAPVSYNWSNGAMSQNIAGLPGGVYSVSISDGAGCMQILDAIDVQEPDSLRIRTISVINSSCADSQDGLIIIDVDGGTPGYLLLWSNGVTNDTMINGMDTLITIPDTLPELNPGRYYVSLIDANNCQKVDSFDIQNADDIPPTIMLMQGSLLIGEDGMAGPGTFDLVDAGTFDNCAIDSVSFDTGVYSCMDIGSYNIPVQVFDNNGNISAATATLNVFDIIPPEIDCSNLPDIVTSSCEPIEFDFPDATDNCTVEQLIQIEGLPSGTHFPAGTTTVTFRAIDECNNMAECSFDVTVNIDLELTVITQDVSCPGEQDGIIDPSASGGTPPYTFNIDADTLAAGSYVVTLMDSGGCSDMTTVTIGEPAVIEYQIDITDVSCNGEADGQAIIDVPDNASFSIEEDPTALGPGQYFITITDAGSGCEQIDSFVIQEPEALGIENVVVQNASCFDSNDCMIEFDVVGGTGTVTQTFSSEIASCDGSVIVQLEDENGCMFTESFILDKPEEIIVNLVSVSASSGSDGMIDVSIEGGIAPYTYEWTDDAGNVFAMTEDIDGLPPGIYTLVINDSNGCMPADVVMFEVEMMVAVEDLEKFNTIISPNPTSNFLHIKFPDHNTRQVTIYGIDGLYLGMYDSDSDQITLDVSTFEAGLYLIKINSGREKFVRHFVKSDN